MNPTVTVDFSFSSNEIIESVVKIISVVSTSEENVVIDGVESIVVVEARSSFTVVSSINSVEVVSSIFGSFVSVLVDVIKSSNISANKNYKNYKS